MIGRAADLDRLPAWSRAPPTPGRGPRRRRGRHRQDPARPGADRPGARRHVVLAGQADPGTRRPPDGAVPRRRCRTGLPTLDPELRPGRARDAERAGRRAGAAGVDLVRGSPARRPTGLVVFEDLHWADSESLAVFERLAEPDGGRARCSSAPTGPTACPAATRPPTSCPASSAATRSPTSASTGSARPTSSAFLAAVLRRGPVVPRRSTRCTAAPAATRSSSRSWWPAPATSLDERSTPRRCRGPSPSWCGPSSTTSTPTCGGCVAAASVLGRRVRFDVLAAVTGTREDELIAAAARRRRQRPAGRGRPRRVQLPPRPRARGHRGRAARPGAPPAPRGGPRRAPARPDSRDHVALRPPRPGRRALRRDGRRGPARRPRVARGSAPPTRRCSWPRPGSPRPRTTSTCAAVATRAAWLAGLLDDADDARRPLAPRWPAPPATSARRRRP